MSTTKRLIGLTGGIATGKSTVADYLASRYHLPILDADDYARQAVALGSPILAAIASRYGPSILTPEGHLNRARLGELIFQDDHEKVWLESQIHPFVRQAFQQAIATAPESTLVLMIPLLFEANLTAIVTEIWTVTCSLTQQQARLQQRNQLNASQALARIHSQWSLGKKVALADVVLDNDDRVETLQAQIDRVMAGHRQATPIN